jgi:hypothetical protein
LRSSAGLSPALRGLRTRLLKGERTGSRNDCATERCRGNARQAGIHADVNQPTSGGYRRERDTGVSIHNPLFGLWVTPEKHGAMHRAGYNNDWKVFLDKLKREGIYGDEALKRTISFMDEIAAKYGLTR